eukprot:TRINITY_DN5442_c0_g1_i5.p1 TRINITY_DN5442_c0_g1~~TRINITY_DN5442_c0_g1_i5.p1  ORF type:complete len:499 (+),score=124.20 TRINITY_DN5442_c0_g1_i5:49-1497(+)
MGNACGSFGRRLSLSKSAKINNKKINHKQLSNDDNNDNNNRSKKHPDMETYMDNKLVVVSGSGRQQPKRERSRSASKRRPAINSTAIVTNKQNLVASLLPSPAAAAASSPQQSSSLQQAMHSESTMENRMLDLQGDDQTSRQQGSSLNCSCNNMESYEADTPFAQTSFNVMDFTGDEDDSEMKHVVMWTKSPIAASSCSFHEKSKNQQQMKAVLINATSATAEPSQNMSASFTGNSGDVMKSIFTQKRKGTLVRLNQRSQLMERLPTFEVDVNEVTLHGHMNYERAITRPVGGEDQMEELEWIALNAIMFTDSAAALFKALHELNPEFCTKKTCPNMTAGSNFLYLWSDGAFTPAGTKQEPEDLCAFEYISNSFNWIEQQVSNPEIFPENETRIPKSSLKVFKRIFKLLFRFYAHAFRHHHAAITALGLQGNLNSCFKLFTLFSLKFNLLDNKELAPMRTVVKMIQSASKGGAAEKQTLLSR